MKKNIILIFLTSMLLSACSSEYEILKSVEAVILTADSSVKQVDRTITFTVKDNTGADLTSEATIYVNGEEIEGNTLTSATVGAFEIKAMYLGVSSELLPVRFHDGSETNFVRRVLVEDYTGTWCGYCPRVAYGIELAREQSPNVIPVAIHRPSSNPASPSYDPYNYNTGELEEIINIPGYPKGMLNRMTQWNFPEPDNLAQAISLTQGGSKMDLAMETTVGSGTINLDVNVKFTQNFNNLKLVVYVLENGLIYDQHNYTTYYGGVDILTNYQHNHVLRAVLTPLLGEAIDSSETVLNNVYTRSFSVPVPANIANAANIEFVAFVVDAQGNAINVRHAGLNETQEFEEM